jgi:hypothetical protein
MQFEPLEVNELQRPAGHRLAFCPRKSAQLQSESHVVQNVQPGQQRIILKHHPTFRGRPGNQPIVEQDSPTRRLQKTGNQVEQGRLAATRGAESDYQLFGVDDQ